MRRETMLAFTKKTGACAGSSLFSMINRATSEVHPAHSAHASTGTARHRWALLLRHLGNHRLGGNEQTRDRRRVLQRGPHDLGRIDDAVRHQVAILAGLCV